MYLFLLQARLFLLGPINVSEAYSSIVPVQTLLSRNRSSIYSQFLDGKLVTLKSILKRHQNFLKVCLEIKCLEIRF